MRKTKRILAVLVALVMTLALLPTVAFAAPAPLTVELSIVYQGFGTTPGLSLKAQTPDGDNKFYYTVSDATQNAPSDGVNISTITGAIEYSADTKVVEGHVGPKFVQVYKTDASGIIIGYGEASERNDGLDNGDATDENTIYAGQIYIGTIDVRDNGVSVGTFSYFYTPGLYINDYMGAGIKEMALSAPYVALAPTITHAEQSLDDWYAKYSTTGDVTVNEAAAAEQASWRSAEDIVENILNAHYQNGSTDSGSTTTFEYKISPRSAYDVVQDANGIAKLVKSDATDVEHVAYTVYESTADVTMLPSTASLTVNGVSYVSGGNTAATTVNSVSGANYDILTNTLTLNGYNGGEIDARYMDLNIVLTGTNSLTDENGITVSGGLTISGNGTLTAVISGGWSDAVAIYAKDGVDIQGGTLNLTTPSAGCGISGDSITINASAASVIAFGEYGLIGKTVTITGDADIKEGNDALSAQAAGTLTLSDDGGYKYSKPYVSIAPKAPAATYAITVQNDGNGTATASATTAAAGTEITLASTPNSGYQFKEWQVISGGVTITSNKFIMPTNAVTVKAIFEAIPGGGDPTPTVYTVTQNPGTYSGSGNAVATINGPYNEFSRLILSGNVVATSNYTKAEGSTIITLNESYVKTLAVGTHTFRAEYTNGYADFTVTIRAAEPTPTPTPSNPAPTPSNPTVPQTGDNSNAGLWSILLVISALGILGAVVWQKKRSKEAQSE